jgi:hypothetical protein
LPRVWLRHRLKVSQDAAARSALSERTGGGGTAFAARELCAARMHRD